ncbi:cellulase family glycosylhydrolase [Streptomyces lancefieldiae]|uniref:Endoglucanase n=1 Tax=Streptomyces lancefieldiae TaxID=3075520 RepID=A0ABU3AWJ2_9ACTN|nr:cellulase family glycosylhydrolase [Streptomyces sp. DSM 40712]MDT0614557.1 cellulase family glycosylhydrolase [Streptomyces sp. DSM 40712]
MKKKLAAATGTALAVCASLLLAVAPQAQAADTPGFHIGAGRLLDANGNDFVMRGVNHAHAWYPDRTDQALSDIKALGANSVRVVLATGDQWTRNDTADVAHVVAECKENRLVCVLEAHDTTGYGEAGAAVPLSRAVDYWLGVKDALVGQEKYVIVNIGNEPYGNSNYSAWTADTKTAIGRMRAAGIDHTLMVDAPNWGQDWSFTMRDNAAGVMAADPDRNTLFDIHMYGVYDTPAEVDDYLGRFVSAGLPVVVGEFGDMHSDGNPDEDAIMATAESRGIGYLGWSWSGNGSGVEYLDLAQNFDRGRLTAWGQRLFNGTNGIKATAEEAGVYADPGNEDTTAPTAPGTPTATGVTADSVRLTWPAATDNTGVSGYDVVRVEGGQETPAASTTTTTATVTGLAADTTYTFAVYARDAAGNRSPRSATVTATTEDNVVGACAVEYRLSDWGSSFNADVTIRNRSDKAIDGWELSFGFPGAQRINSVWNARATQQGSTVRATHEAWTRTIPAGGSVSFGLNGSSSGGNGTPTAFTLNGQTCGS